MISSLLNDLWRISLCVIYNVLDQSFKCCSSNRYCINGTLFKIVLLEQTQRITAFTMCNQKTCSQANRMTECCRLLILLLLNYWTYLSGQLNRDTSKKTDELSNKKELPLPNLTGLFIRTWSANSWRKPAETHHQKPSDICIRSAARHRHLDLQFSFCLPQQKNKKLANILWKTSFIYNPRPSPRLQTFSVFACRKGA